MALLFYLLALIALATSTAAVYMALLKPFPVQWLYYHYFIRKPLVWTILIGAILATFWITRQTGAFPLWALVPLALMALAALLTDKMHQENAFKAVDFPAMAEDVSSLPLQDAMQLGVIEYGGMTKAYPLAYVIHHHIVNDRFGDRIVALTYCAMCRTIIPFDVTEIGPLFVGSFKDANMIVADRKTKTFFQQATFQSIIGALHPHTLTMIPFQILSWGEVRKLDPMPKVVKVTEKDFREFQLPIPGVWRKITASEVTPGLSAKERDKTFPARTHVVGVIDPIAQPPVAYLKEELVQQGMTYNEELGIFLVAVNDAVVGFKRPQNGRTPEIALIPDNTLLDASGGTVWNIRGKRISGAIQADLEPIALSDEYWFSWRKFHPESRLIRLS
ncbi:MAG: DUF3179 domain-containing protein [Caldilineaceae bacterium]|nr:DUF3179 domain-containing protein [Caldilineaceae bacterium]